MPKLAIYNQQGKETGSIDLPKEYFGSRINQDILHQAVVMYQACQRQGTVSTKGRSEVSGGGRKPFRQKGTGRARAGSIRSPLWKGGGVVFGPKPRDFSYTVPKKVRTAALRESLNDKFQSKNLHCVEDLKDKLAKTKEFAKILSNLKLDGKILGLLDDSDPSVMRTSRNIARFSLMRTVDVNAYDVLRCKKLLVSRAGIQKLLDRIK